MKRHIDVKTIIILILVTLLLGSGYLNVRNLLEEKPEPFKFEATNDLDEELKDAREFVKSLPYEDPEYMRLIEPPYGAEWHMVNAFSAKFGYKNKECLEIIVGNHKGDKYFCFKIKDAYHPEVVQIPYKANEKIYFNDDSFDYSNFLMFEKGSYNYIMDSKLNVWKASSADFYHDSADDYHYY